MTTFVLIPGAGTDPRVYGATIEALRRRGHRALAPPLPLHDQKAGPSNHADSVATAASGETDIVVVAQSLGAFTGLDSEEEDYASARRARSTARCVS